MKGTAGFPIRLRYSKRGKVRFVGHRDVARAFERAFRIARLPLAFSEGFNPHPKISFGLALSVGYESDAEYLDFEVTDVIECDALPRRLSDALPDGMEIEAARPLADRAPALQDAVTATEWALTVPPEHPGAVDLNRRVEAVLAAGVVEVLRTRKGKTVPGDIRPAIRRLEFDGTVAGPPTLHLELVPTNTANARPAEVLDALAQVPVTVESFAGTRVLRTRQWIDRDGERLDPLDADERPIETASVVDAGARPPAARAS